MDRSGAAALFTGGTAFSLATSVVAGVLTARWLGPADFGVLSVVRSLYVGAAIVAPLGLDLALLRHLGGGGASALAQVPRLRRLCGVVNIVAALGVALLLGPWLGAEAYPTPHFAGFLALAFVALPFAADAAILTAVLRATGAVTAQNLAVLFLQPVVRLAALLLLLSAGAGVGGVLASSALGAAAASVAMGWALRRRERADRPQAPPDRGGEGVGPLLRTGAWMAALLLLYNGLRVVDVLALGWFRPASEVGGYAALAGVAYLITVPGQALSQTLAPAVARLHAAGDMAGARAELRGYLRRAGLFSAPLFAGVAAFGPWLDLLFGARYAFVPGLCLTLATAFLVSGCLGPMAASLTMTGRHRQEVAVLLAGAAATVGLCGLLIPRCGGEGAALAVLAGYLLVNGARAALSARVLGGLDVRPADFAAPVACLAVALAWRAVLQGFCPHDWPTAIWGAGVLLSGFAGLYAGVLLTPQERTALLALLGLARRRAAA